MSRQNVIFAALGSLALAAVPLVAANAQSGDALAHAERACIDSGVGPNTAGFNTCVDRAAFAFDRGQPGMAYRAAAMVRDANNVCLSYGLSPRTLGYKGCVGNQIEKGTVAAYTAEPIVIHERPHVAVSVDTYGFRYDRDGNLLDQNGYVIRYVP
ncbi:MAG TPA: hypothetical protein VMI56_19390 [Reyranella sp.]|nr:hypothetical protein [Reyranella sp.]